MAIMMIRVISDMKIPLLGLVGKYMIVSLVYVTELRNSESLNNTLDSEKFHYLREDYYAARLY